MLIAQTRDMSSQPSLLERAAHPRDVDAWAEFYAFYSQLVLHYARAQIGPKLAREAVQETFVRLARRMPACRGKRRPDLQTLVFQVADACVQDALRRRRKAVLVDAPELPDGANGEVRARRARWDRELRRQVTHVALERLRQEVDTPCFQVLHLCVIEGYRPAVACEHLGIDREALYEYRQHALRRLCELTAIVRREHGAEDAC